MYAVVFRGYSSPRTFVSVVLQSTCSASSSEMVPSFVTSSLNPSITQARTLYHLPKNIFSTEERHWSRCSSAMTMFRSERKSHSVESFKTDIHSSFDNES